MDDRTDTRACCHVVTAALRSAPLFQRGGRRSGAAVLSAADPTHLFRRACQAVVGARDGVAVFGTDYDTPDGNCIRDYVHVSDLADAHIAALDHLLDGRAIFALNVGYGPVSR